MNARLYLGQFRESTPDAKESVVFRFCAWRSAQLIPVGTAGILVPFVLYLAGCNSVPPPAPFHTDGIPPTPLITAERRPEFVGSDACRDCHKAQFDDHATSLHATTLFSGAEPRVADLFKTDQVLADHVLGATYTFGARGAEPISRVKEKSGKETELVPAFGVGSGRYGMTPVYSRNGVYMEGRVSHYATLGKWFWTPGQQDKKLSRQPEGRILDRDETVRCFLCHGTAVVQTDEDPIGPQSLFQVGCERCHGPGRDHVQAAGQGKKGGGLYTFSAATSSTVLQLCAQCHRHPTDASGEDLAHDVNLPRFAGTALAASKCFKRSQGKLSCTTCHNPHRSVSTDNARYVAACLSCHSGQSPTEPPCPVNPKDDCIPCHMPLQSIEFPGDPKFHNHWIRPYLASRRKTATHTAKQ